MADVYDVAEIAELDLERESRRGYGEAIYCESKTPDQVRAIAAELHANNSRALFTRVSPENRAAITEAIPDAAHDEDARISWWPAELPAPEGRPVVVACAGTSDLPVAREALLTARFHGREAELIVDVGVAGLHRVLRRLDTLNAAGCIVVVAGMDGALPSVIAGLVSAPVIACPTSVGYGAAFEGLAALLAMLNACAPGVAVVNIDNGYGAGHMAAQITER